MRVTIQKTGKLLELEHSGTAAALLARLGINPEEVLIVKDGALVTLHDDVSGARELELLSVISGG